MKTKHILTLLQELEQQAIVAYQQRNVERWERYQHIINILEEELGARRGDGL